MLCLNIKNGEWIQIGDAMIRVIRIENRRITLGIQAPPSTVVLREKLLAAEPRRDAQ